MELKGKETVHLVFQETHVTGVSYNYDSETGQNVRTEDVEISEELIIYKKQRSLEQKCHCLRVSKRNFSRTIFNPICFRSPFTPSWLFLSRGTSSSSTYSLTLKVYIPSNLECFNEL